MERKVAFLIGTDGVGKVAAVQKVSHLVLFAARGRHDAGRVSALSPMVPQKTYH